MRAIHVGASVAALLLVFVSCGGNKGTPTPPSPTITSVTFSSSTDFLKVKETVEFAATATHSDGSSTPVSDWRSDTPTVATVDAVTGKVTGVSAGTATIVATHDGMSATKPVRVAPNFVGTWKGEFKMTSCSFSGNWSWDPCDVDSSVGPAEFEFSQNREQVTGITRYSILFEYGVIRSVVGSVSGTINTSGHLTLTGVFTNPSDHVTYTLTADGNDLYIPADRVLGSFKVNMTTSSLQGHGTTAYSIGGDGLTKVQ